MRKSNIYKSAIVGLLEEIVSIVSGFVLPRMILSCFGSDYNGIIASVTQFIGCITLLKSGIGMATKAALYDPLYHNEKEKIEGIMSATMKFLRRVSYIFIVGIIVFACIYPFCLDENFSWGFTASLVLIVSLGTFFQYYFGLGNQLLLEADQKYYIVAIITIVNVFFSTIISVVCMKLGMSIHGVKLSSSIVYCSTPIILNCYVNKKYNLNRKADPDWNSISKRWDAFGMQIANFVNSNTDIIIVSLFLNMKEVSVYTIYYLVINGIKKIVVRLSTGVEAALGNLKAESNSEKLKNNFLLFEFVLNFICSFMFSCLIILIVPFVNIYTKGITDVNYTRIVFAIVACTAELFFCLRLAYTYMVQATGAFSETKQYFYIEAVINIVFSVALVNYMGLVGVVIGTLIAMLYRTIVLAYFVYNKVIEVNFWHFVKGMATTIGSITICSYVGLPIILNLQINDYFQWFEIAIVVGIFSIIATTMIRVLTDFIFMKKITQMIIKRMKN